MAAAVTPLPTLLTTPPVQKIYLGIASSLEPCDGFQPSQGGRFSLAKKGGGEGHPQVTLPTAKSIRGLWI
jgi:hypothetical protein